MYLKSSRRSFNRGILSCLLAVSVSLGSAFAQNAAPQSKPPIRVTLLQLNDVYQIAPVDKGKAGGLARVATLVKQIEAQNPNTFLVLAGDTISPSIASRLFQGRQMIDLWNKLGLDVAALGNHEFDFGNDVLLQRMAESHFPWVNANVYDSTTNKPFGNSVPYIVKDVNGVKVGFFGLLTPDTLHASHPGANVDFKDPYYSACETVGKMRQAGVDVVVAVTHLAMNQDKQMARMMPYRMALIMGGHEHTLLQSLAAGVPIFKMGSDARNLGRIDLLINPETRQMESMDWEVIPVTDKIVEDPAVVEVVKGYEEKINAELGQVIGETSVELDALQKTNRGQETNLGSFVADIYRTRLNADVGIINGGSIRSNTTYGPGKLTRRDILTILPFGNQVVKVEVTGKQLKDALENGVSRLTDEEAGRFPQVSGLRFVYDPAKPVGQRVVSVQAGSQPLSLTKVYTLASTAYLVGGGDDYLMFKGVKYLINPEEAPLEADIVMDAVSQAKVIAPKTDGRIAVGKAAPAAAKPAAKKPAAKKR